jgi:hypothetical protein
MKRKRWFDPKLPFDVTAFCEDEETPCVLLQNADMDVCLTDSQAHELINRLKRALSVLPTSK